MVSYGTASITVREAYLTAGAVTFNSDAAFTRYPAIELAIHRPPQTILDGAMKPSREERRARRVPA